MSTFRSLTAALVFVSLPLTALVPAMAQDAGDPPDSVGRIAETSGTVSFHPAGSQDWQAASPNYPVTAGSGVWAEPRSHASVDINGARVHLDGASDLEVTAIDPQSTQLSVPQGAVFVHVYPGAAGQSYEVDTPRGAARFAQPGQYEIEAGDDQHPMTLTVFEGVAQLVGQSANMNLQPGQRGVINPDNSSSTAQAQPDDFVRTVQAAEQPYANTQQTAQYVSPAETGYQDLARYGQWQQAPQYGAVWYPQQVAADWAPYRYGHWAYVAPWGWTWVDDAPWGFTPFHYGRWVQVGDRWGWVPGERVERPVYAPALVSFFGNIGGVGIDLSIGSVGWVPLAPEEVYVPPYRHSPRYVHDINVVNVRNQTKIVNVVNNVTVVNYNNYTNRRGATMVDRRTMADSRSVASAYRSQPHDNGQRWAHAKPVTQVAVQPQASNRPGKAPRFDQQQSSNAQFAARAEQGKPRNWNGNNNAQVASQPQQSKQRTKNAAPGPAVQPQMNAAANPAAKPNWQGQPNAQGQGQGQSQTARKSKNATPAPVILPQDQNGQAAAQPQKQKTWKAGQAPQPTTTASGNAAPNWKQNRPAQPATSPETMPNQLPASRENKNAPSSTAAQPNWQKSNQKNTTRNNQPNAAQPTPQVPVPPANQPTARQSNKQQWQQQNGGQQSDQSKQQAHSQAKIPQPQGQSSRQQQPQGKGQENGQGQGNAKPKPDCNPQTGACTQQ